MFFCFRKELYMFQKFCSLTLASRWLKSLHTLPWNTSDQISPTVHLITFPETPSIINFTIMFICSFFFWIFKKPQRMSFNPGWCVFLFFCFLINKQTKKWNCELKPIWVDSAKGFCFWVYTDHVIILRAFRLLHVVNMERLLHCSCLFVTVILIGVA